jgi:hypothetical protein
MALHRFDDVAACRDRTTCMVGLRDARTPTTPRIPAPTR